jgi:Icc protein
MSEVLVEDSRRVEPLEADVVQLVQITDCHIFANAAEKLRGLNTRDSFEAVKSAVIESGASLDMLLATGDLSQDASADSYRYLARQFDGFAAPTFWIPGNHDEIDTLKKHFTGKRIHAAKHVLAGAWQIVMLDSTISGEVHGRVAESQLGFLDAALTQHPDQHALVCLHHQAIEAGSEWIDNKGLREADQLRARLRQHENIRAVLWGHVHQEIHRSIDGIEWMSTPSSCVQFKPGSRHFAIGSEAPGYRQLSLNADGTLDTVVHRIDPIGVEIENQETGY